MNEEIIDTKWRYPELGEYPILFGEYKNKHYPQIPCLVLYKGMYGVRFWNCTEECWDDEECDDFFIIPTFFCAIPKAHTIHSFI